MAIYDLSHASTTSLNTDLEDYSVDANALDYVSSEKETYWTFDEATKNFGYYKEIPELKAAIDALAIWTVGKGYEVDSPLDKVILEHIKGWGQDTFQSILQSMIVIKKIVGDAFCEIIKKGDVLVNLKPISPERVRLVISPNGLIKRYDIMKKDGSYQPLDINRVFHLCNDRVADEIHGTSIIDSCKWVIDARHEALNDERKIKHRELALGVLYVDTDNVTKRNEIIKQYGEAVKNGEVLVLPKDVAELKDTGIAPKDRLAWIQYLENFFYQAVKVPRVIATSENYTEAASKVGYLTFEPIYTSEQKLLEAEIWNQLAIKIKFNRPASLGGLMEENEEKNTGQIGFQPKDTQATIGRE